MKRLLISGRIVMNEDQSEQQEIEWVRPHNRHPTTEYNRSSITTITEQQSRHIMNELLGRINNQPVTFRNILYYAFEFNHGYRIPELLCPPLTLLMLGTSLDVTVMEKEIWNFSVLFKSDGFNRPCPSYSIYEQIDFRILPFEKAEMKMRKTSLIEESAIVYGRINSPHINCRCQPILKGGASTDVSTLLWFWKGLGDAPCFINFLL